MLFKNKAAAAGEMHRVLKPGGRVVVLVWQSLDQHPLNKAIQESLSRRMGVDITTTATAFSLGNAADLANLVSQAGFSKVSIYPVQYYTFVDDPEQFMELNLKSAAAVMPVFTNLDDQERSELVAGITADIEPVMTEYLQGGRLIYPQAANIAVAIA